MEHRRLGRTELTVSAIGLGTEHLDYSGDTIQQVINTALGAGVNYIDLLTSDASEDRGFRERLAPLLRAHRERFVLAANWGHPHLYLDLDYTRSCFEGLLEQVGNYVEVAKVMMIDTETKWRNWGLGSLELLRAYQAEGRVGHVGASGHYAPVAIGAVESGLIDVLMFPLNMTTHDHEPVRELCQACIEHDVGVVAMKAYGGGSLLLPRPDALPPTTTQCLHYVLSQPVSTTVPGAKNAAELQSTLAYLDATDEDKDYRALLPHMGQMARGQCNYCNHCLPCPQDIDVGQISFLADAARSGFFEDFASEYDSLLAPATACTECGVCAERCPFDVDVVANMQQAAAIYEGATA